MQIEKVINDIPIEMRLVMLLGFAVIICTIVEAILLIIDIIKSRRK